MKMYLSIAVVVFNILECLEEWEGQILFWEVTMIWKCYAQANIETKRVAEWLVIDWLYAVADGEKKRKDSPSHIF